MRSIDMAATAAEAEQGEVAVERFVHRLSGVDEQRGCLLVIEVTTAVRISGIDLEVPHR
jgi:hypothetical protein